MNKVISDIQFEDKVTCNSKSDFFIKTEHSVGDDYGINGEASPSGCCLKVAL